LIKSRNTKFNKTSISNCKGSGVVGVGLGISELPRIILKKDLKAHPTKTHASGPGKITNLRVYKKNMEKSKKSELLTRNVATLTGNSFSMKSLNTM